MDNKVLHISLGNDCCIAYQLKKYNKLEKYYPFDWIKTKNFNVILDLIENKFENFINPEYLVKYKDSDKFFSFSDDDNNNNYCNTEKEIYKNTLYNICFYHDIINEEFYNKYNRRINRFYQDIIDMQYNNLIVFYRFVGSKNLNENSKKRFDKIIKNINPNVKYKLIEIIALQNDNIEFIDWKRDNYDWKNIFNNSDN